MDASAVLHPLRGVTAWLSEFQVRSMIHASTDLFPLLFLLWLLFLFFAHTLQRFIPFFFFSLFSFSFFPSAADLALSQHIRANCYQLWKVRGPRARFLAQLQELFPSPLQWDLPMGLPVCRNQLLHVQAHTAEMTISFLHPISQKQSNPPSFFKVANVSVQLLEADLCPSVPARGTAFRAVYDLLAQQYKNSRPRL